MVSNSWSIIVEFVLSYPNNCVWYLDQKDCYFEGKKTRMKKKLKVLKFPFFYSKIFNVFITFLLHMLPLGMHNSVPCHSGLALSILSRLLAGCMPIQFQFPHMLFPNFGCELPLWFSATDKRYIRTVLIYSISLYHSLGHHSNVQTHKYTGVFVVCVWRLNVNMIAFLLTQVRSW